MVCNLRRLPVPFVILHVGNGVDTDDRANDRDNQNHDQGEVVAINHRMRIMRRYEKELEKGQERDLEDEQHDDDAMPVFDPVKEYDDEQQKIGDSKAFLHNWCQQWPRAPCEWSSQSQKHRTHYEYTACGEDDGRSNSAYPKNIARPCSQKGRHNEVEEQQSSHTNLAFDKNSLWGREYIKNL